jgi:hypothetical protein
MSSNYAVMGLAMAAAGVLTDEFGARAVWIGAGVVYLTSSLVALVLTRWLPVAVAEEQGAFEASSESAVAALATGNGAGQEHPPADDGKPESGLERIATLLEEIDERRKAESRARPNSASAEFGRAKDP